MAQPLPNTRIPVSTALTPPPLQLPPLLLYSPHPPLLCSPNPPPLQPHPPPPPSSAALTPPPPLLTLWMLRPTTSSLDSSGLDCRPLTCSIGASHSILWCLLINKAEEKCGQSRVLLKPFADFKRAAVLLKPQQRTCKDSRESTPWTKNSFSASYKRLRFTMTRVSAL